MFDRPKVCINIADSDEQAIFRPIRIMDFTVYSTDHKNYESITTNNE